MFEPNDYVMYGITGVCKVLEITTETFKNSIKKKYYVLKPKYSNNTIIKVPVDNEKISIRKLLTKEEIASLINSMPEKEPLWIEDEKSRSEEYKAMVRTGDCDNLVTIIKGIHLNQRNKKINGKKLSKKDEEFKDLAERLINEEFAEVLQIKPEEVTNYIIEHVPQ